MRVAIVHNELGADSKADEQDVLAQTEAVADALACLGNRVSVLACGLDLETARRRLKETGSNVVFNLVESLNGTGRLIGSFPGLLEAMGLPYTGAGAEALFLTSNKLLAKAWLHAAGLPTPPWVSPCAGSAREPYLQGPVDLGSNGHWIVKSVWEHASIGLDGASIVDAADPRILNSAIQEREPLLGGSGFAEAYIDGREFNLSLLEEQDGVQVLPPAEILFEGFGEDMARIVDYRAKWDEASYEYHHTPRTFSFADRDAGLLEQLQTLAKKCWNLFGLKGYARVDFRVDLQGRPWILEINANPCLSPDAGFAAAVSQAGMGFDAAVQRILAAAGPWASVDRNA